MLDQNILAQVRQHLDILTGEVTFRIEGNKDTDSFRQAYELLIDLTTCSDHLHIERRETSDEVASFYLLHNDKETGIGFMGLPLGHEFTSLLLAILNCDGKGKNLPDSVLQRRIAAIKGPVTLRTYVSLSCTNCPDVVQSLNIIALYNDSISNLMVEGSVAEDEVKKLGIQSVPTVCLDEEILSVGRIPMADIIDRLEEVCGVRSDVADEEHILNYDVVVAGAGPAGAAAAIYSARKGFRTAVVASRVGGQVNDTMAIDNLINVTSTTGPELSRSLGESMEKYGVDVYIDRRILDCELKGKEKTIICAGGERFVSPVVIVATGAAWRRLGVPGESDYMGKGIAFCTHCDGPFFAGKRVAVVGGGNSGIEAAIDLSSICSHVDVFEFLDVLKADEVLRRNLASIPNVDVHLMSAVSEIVGDGTKVTGVKVKSRETGEITDYAVDGVFLQIGLSPNSAPFNKDLEVNKAGEIVTNRRGETGVEGVFAAGDVTDTPFKQVAIAIGQGAVAALSAFEYRLRN